MMIVVFLLLEAMSQSVAFKVMSQSVAFKVGDDDKVVATSVL
jgi:hypothetical protein